MGDRLFKGLAAVLLIAAGLWLAVRSLRAPAAPDAVPVSEFQPLETLKGAPVPEGERAASSIPPLKLTREKKIIRRTDSVPPPSP